MTTPNPQARTPNPASAQDPPQVDAIFRAVNRVTTIGRHFLRADARQPAIVHARVVAALVLRAPHPGGRMSWPAAGRTLHRSHNALLELVQHHQHRHQVRRDVDAVLARLQQQQPQGDA